MAERLLYVVVISVVFVLVACSSQEDGYSGTKLTSQSHATEFELANQLGERVRLSDYQGKVVALTFLYTNCLDVCTVVAGQIRRASEILRDVSEDVEFIVISVDPERDSIEQAYIFSQRWEMIDEWDFLVGTREELSPIWKAYFLDPALHRRTDVNSGSDEESAQSQEVRPKGVSALRQDIENQYLVVHSTPVYIIDRQGVARVVFTSPFSVEALVHDIEVLVD